MQTWWLAGLGRDDNAPPLVSHFVYWVMGIAVAAWLVTSDFMSIQMVGMALVFTTCGGTIGWVHGYSDRDREAREEVLLREGMLGKN